MIEENRMDELAKNIDYLDAFEKTVLFVKSSLEAELSSYQDEGNEISL